MLLSRILTALILAPLFIWAIFSMPTDYFSYLLLSFVALGAWEFTRLIKIDQPFYRTLVVSGIIGCAFIASAHAENLQTVLIVSVVWWGLNLYWVISYPKNIDSWYGSGIIRVMGGVMLLAPMWVALSSLHANYGNVYFLLLMLLIWGADTGAYFVGRAFGKRKLAPKISPGKSIEGVIGGTIFAVIIMLAFLQNQNIALQSYAGYLILAVIISSVSVLGDLYESLFKRTSGIKDSGNILPGHGGILDRIDSLTAAAPFFLLGLGLL
ncbi:Phosphatidate cytidylyltransferase [Bathymodiolus heckerae thiotrophic gill symbiont]|uniref:phosphatidate cytidylyltransferase n=1 Tax=Bathymodiolus heckerae thiotrophic gill symbiont TaxID=1052212 RepID=UPI0010B2890A|nr:phosphatidate cytidylyltransferase [Bathymodiolus heckerae thiotrophic gill symbiont]SHN91550.1 Phosphatidate cytidylyltransferase [Bathymodiolus heckerae thiotrophic gill symbiont]